MKLQFKYFNRTALHLAIQNQNIEIIKCLLSVDYIDVNIRYVLCNIAFKIQTHKIE